MRKTIKLPIALLAFLFITLLSIPSFAASKNGVDLSVDHANKAKAVYLYSFDGDRVLVSAGGDKILAPVSTAKMMAGLLVCERYYDKINDKLTVTSEMLQGHQGTSMGLKAGMSLTLKDLFFGTVCGNNNDAALAMASYCAGSVSAFVDEMNKYAKRLDMRNTNYTDPTGMDNKATTTLDDVAKLSRKAVDTPLYLEASSLPSYTVSIEGEALTVFNRNALISQFSAQGYTNKNANGLIAGSTEESGYMLCTYVEKNGERLLCIVMGAMADANEIYSYAIANSLIDKSLGRFSMQKIVSAGEAIHSEPIELAIADNGKATVVCTVPEDVFSYLPKEFDPKLITQKVYMHEQTLKAPIMQGVIVGGVDFYYDGEYITSSRLTVGKSVESSSLLSLLDEMRSFFLGRIFWITIIVSVPSIIVYAFIKRRALRKSTQIVRFKRFY